MEPTDIIGLKNPSTSAAAVDSARLPVEIIKNKRQFSYSRLNEDLMDSPVASIVPAGVPRSQSATPREEPLLIDLSAEPTAQLKSFTNNNHLIPFSVPQPETNDQNRLYENCPTVVSPLPSPPPPQPARQSDLYGGSHYYSEVPFEPVLAPPPPSKPTSPVSPARPEVSEELRKKRDEAFDWLGQALGDMTLSKSTRSHSSADHYSLPFKIQPPSSNPVRHGFEDDFAAESPSKVAGTTFQPHYPKPGSWPDNGAVASLSPGPTTTHWEQLIASRIASHHPPASVQTAHVRPFMVAPTSSQPDGSSDRSSSALVIQVRQSAPWASEQEVKQAIVINNNNPLEAVRFLQVEKLYR